MDFYKFNLTSTFPQQKSITERGFATVAILAFLPVFTVSVLILLFSQYLTKNWMRSVYTCRIELLQTQQEVGKNLERLLNLNKVAKSLRLALEMAKIELLAALAAQNAAWVAKVRIQIHQIEMQQKALDTLQKSIIAIANLKMNSGVFKVANLIRQQDRENQALLPDFFKFRIKNIIPNPKTLAVKPDKPGVAPIYELKPKFNDSQSLHVSWISEFKTAEKGPIKWLTNKHQKNQYCQASLKEDGSKFKQVLNEDKLF